MGSFFKISLLVLVFFSACKKEEAMNLAEEQVLSDCEEQNAQELLRQLEAQSQNQFRPLSSQEGGCTLEEDEEISFP